MSDTLDEFAQKFQTEPLQILKLDYWTWSVRPVHATLGAGVLSLNRFCASLGAINRNESIELGAICTEIERRLGQAFSPDKYNYLMLMMIDAHLHFHVIPRYHEPRNFFNKEWRDGGWPALPQLSDGGDLQNDPVLIEIRDCLRLC